MKNLLKFILTEITGSKDFKIKEETDGDFINLDVSAAKDLMGIIIGKEGRVIKAIRSLLKVKATLEKKGVALSVNEKA